VLLKWLGERGEAARGLVRRAAAVSAPIDLAAAGNALDSGFNQRVYTQMFLYTLRAKALAMAMTHGQLFDANRAAAARTLRAYDDAVTAPLHGFRDADDYWARASSAPWLGSIRVPTLLLNARNDPFLPPEALERAAARASAAVLLEFPRSGGHAGFPGRNRWMARRVLEFLSQP
jgi:predicted alpha/beta-fold hydrolase